MTNPNAWSIEQLLEHAEWIRKLAHMLVRDPATAEDLAQDTWVQALKSPPQQQGPLKPWLATILRNLVRERFRKTERRERRELIAEGPCALEPAEDLTQRAEAQKLVVEFVLELPAHYRDVVLLSYFEGLSGPEIAERMGIPEVTVRSRLKRGLDQLRERFDRKYGDRTAWVVMLMPLVKRPNGGAGVSALPDSGASVAAKSGAAKALIGAAATLLVATPLLWWITRQPDSVPTPEAPTVQAPAIIEAPISPEVTRTPAAPEPAAPAPSIVPMATYEITIVAPDGAPAVGADIEVRKDEFRPEVLLAAQNGEHVTRTLKVSKTDSGGRASFSFPRGLSFEARIRNPGSAEVVLRDRQAGARETLRLRRSGTLSGRIVKAADGAPVSGAKVRVIRVGTSDFRPIAEVTSDAIGSYRIEGLPPERLLALVIAPGFALDPVYVQVAAGAAINADVKMNPVPSVVGSVTDARTGTPIVGAHVGFAQRGLETATDETGRFEISGYCADGAFFPWIDAPGFGYRTLFPPVRGGVATTLETNIELEPSYRLRGIAVDENGQPIPALRIFARSEQPDTAHPTPRYPQGFPKAELRECTTGADGSFELAELRPDTRHFLIASDPRFALQGTLVPEHADDVPLLDVGKVEFAHARCVFGRVVDPDGAPLGGVEVIAIPRSPLLKQLIPDEAIEGAHIFAIDVQATLTDGDGWYCFNTVGYGDVLFRLFDTSHSLIEQAVVDVARSRMEEQFDWKTDARPVLHGFARDPVGNAVAGAVVSVRNANDAGAEVAQVDALADGSFQVFGLPPGRYRAQAAIRTGEAPWSGMRASEPVVVETLGPSVLLVLLPAQWLQVELEAREHSAIVGAECVFTTTAEPPESFRVTTGLDGHCFIGLPPATAFEVEVHFAAEADGSTRQPYRTKCSTTAAGDLATITMTIDD